jgi:hypothetical protein
MTDDELLEGIRRAAREKRHVDRWEALAAGELSDAELAELEAQARDDPEVARALEAYRPLDSGARARIVERLERQLARPEAAREPRAPFWRRFWVWAPACAVAAAAAIVLLLWPAGLPDLPRYSLAVRGGVQAVRGDPAPEDLPRFEAGSTLEITLRPQRAVEGPVEARVFVEEGDGVRRLGVTVEKSATGAVRLRARVGQELRLPDGVHRLVVAVGRPGGLPDAERVQRWLREGRPAVEEMFVLLTTRVRVVAER